jgi:Chromosome segregation protein Spc25
MLVCFAFVYFFLLHSFSFTQLDPNDPERRFSFHLSTNEQDDFVVHVLTTLDNSNDNSDDGGGEILFEPVIQALKETEDLAAFVRDMRKTFLHQLSSSSSSSSTASHSNSPSETRTNE